MQRAILVIRFYFRGVQGGILPPLKIFFAPLPELWNVEEALKGDQEC